MTPVDSRIGCVYLLKICSGEEITVRRAVVKLGPVGRHESLRRVGETRIILRNLLETLYCERVSSFEGVNSEVITELICCVVLSHEESMILLGYLPSILRSKTP